ncbi:hypothetical protein BX261_3190 [Streptomyces sp. 2321.6]|nr:hypothetical protein BX261_3190 [Streptomyces sp. 2321.6]
MPADLTFPWPGGRCPGSGSAGRQLSTRIRAPRNAGSAGLRPLHRSMRKPQAGGLGLGGCQARFGTPGALVPQPRNSLAPGPALRQDDQP